MNIYAAILWSILGLILLIGIMVVMWQLTDLHFAHAQSNTTPVPPTSPTVTNVPTPTTPQPNWQFLPQKAYVQPFGPEVGVPPNALPLTAVPQVIPLQPQVQQQGIGGFDMNTVMSVIAMITSAGSGFLGKMGFDKAKNAQQTGQANAEMNVQQATIQQKTLEQVYENMPDKGNSINDKPEIRLSEVADVKDEALKTAAKA